MCKKSKFIKSKKIFKCFLVLLLIILNIFSCVQISALGILEDTDIVIEKFDPSNDDTVDPLWSGANHKDTVDGNDGVKNDTALDSFLKVMSVVPDNEDYTLYYAFENYDYFQLDETGEVITLSDNTTLDTGDTNFNMRKMQAFHGGGNYVASVKFLYNVARNLVMNDYSGTRVEVIEAAIADSIGDNSLTLLGDNNTYCKSNFSWEEIGSDGYPCISSITSRGVFTSLEQRITLEKAIYLIANTFFTGQGNAFQEIVAANYGNVDNDKAFEVKTALKIIGIATHLCGDIYAHKTVVPLDTTFVATVAPEARNNETIYRGSENDFYGNGRWSRSNGIKTLIQAGSTITTQQIKKWQNNDSLAASYVDFTGFYSERLTEGATKLVANMYDNYFNGTNLGEDRFFVNWFLHDDYNLRLANLKLYTHLIDEIPTRPKRLEKLNNLDSSVAISDVYPTDGVYTTPNVENNTWNKGYVNSYIG